MVCFLSPTPPVHHCQTISRSPQITLVHAPNKPAKTIHRARLPEHPSPPPPPPPPTNYNSLLSETYRLATSRGALGRGARACLRAFHRRACFTLSATKAPQLYVEIGPAYVLATAKISRVEHVTRYAVEQRAWPALQLIHKWEETDGTEARMRGATLRYLTEGRRFGRHLFISRQSLAVIIKVAEELLGVKEIKNGGAVEAFVPMKRKPLPGSSIAVRCPRGDQHSNGDRKPSLILWMNEDGKSGGGVCTVCRRGDKFLTWRVRYVEGGAELCVPFGREWMGKDETVENKVEEKDGKEGIGGNVIKDLEDIGGNGGGYVTAWLKGEGVESLDGARMRSVGNMVKYKNPIEILLASDRRSKGAASVKKAEQVAWFVKQAMEIEGVEDEDEMEGWLPTPLVSVSAMKPSGWKEILGNGGGMVKVPTGWEPIKQEWILWDIDDIQGLGGEDVVEDVAKGLVGVVRRERELSGGCLIMQTGPEGMHIWAELREGREQPREWFSKKEIKEWYAKVGERYLKKVKSGGGSGGKVDMSSCCAGRFGRRPGWRICGDGVFRCRVVVYVPSRVRNRKPRI